MFFTTFYELAWFRFIFPCSRVLIASRFDYVGSLIRDRAQPRTSYITNLLLRNCCGILQVGIFFLFLVLVQFFRLPWKQYTFGIAVGFGVSAAGSLVAFVVRSEFGTKFDPIFRFVVPLTYTIGVAIWLMTFLWPVPKAPVMQRPRPSPPKPWLQS